MPNLVMADTGIISFLNARLNNVFPSGGKNLTLKLYINNHAPFDVDTASTYTEASGGGYSAKILSSGFWTISTVGGIPQALYTEQSWSFTGALTGAATVYGAYIIDADGVLVGAQALASPYTPSRNGDFLTIIPIIQGSKGNPT